MRSAMVSAPDRAWVSQPEEPVRPLRSDSLRNRIAVVDALLDLFRQGELQPSSNQIAERAGISPRSLFRYFDDIDDLVHAAIARHLEACWPLLPIDTTPEAPLTERIEALVDQRQRLFEHIAPVATATRLRAPFQPVIAAQLARGRAYLRQQIVQLFAAELAEASRTSSTNVLAIADVLVSFESYQLLRLDQGLSATDIHAALRNALFQIFRLPVHDEERT